MMDPLMVASRLLDPPRPAWHDKARPEQLPPEGDWKTWYVRGGRGSGKTWTGGNTLADMIRENPGQQWACIGPTFSDARDVMIEGAKSGLLAALDLPRTYPGWNRSQGQLWLPDGTVVFCDGANDGAYRIQGKNLAGAWCDEIGLWVKWAIAWDESISFAVRMDPARIVATGTPKRGHPLVKRLIEDSHVRKSLLKTMDNIANLSKSAVEELVRRYKGTSLEAQELEGEMLDEAEGALFTFDEAQAAAKGLIRYGKPPTTPVRIAGTTIQSPDLLRTVVAVDPAVSSGESSDEWGIVVVALAADGKIYVQGDVSAQCAPQQAAQRIVKAYHDYEADRIVYEANQGGELVKVIIDQVEAHLPVSPVRAYQGKHLRAEPVQHAYQQGRVLHEHAFAQLETQMVGWEPNSGQPSPDRLDALVHGVRELDSGHGGKVQGVPHPLG